MAIKNLIPRRKPASAQLAKDRLKIIVARERTSTGDNVASYLPALKSGMLLTLSYAPGKGLEVRQNDKLLGVEKDPEQPADPEVVFQE